MLFLPSKITIWVQLHPIPTYVPLMVHDPTKEDYRDDPEPYQQLLELVVRSLDVASREGVMLRTGERVHLIPLGNKGDWPYLES